MKVWDKVEYWERHTKDGVSAREDHNFVSIHKHNEPIGPNWSYIHVGYSLCSPLSLVDDKTGERPTWENAVFQTKKDAVLFASNLVKRHKLKAIVYCGEGGKDNADN